IKRASKSVFKLLKTNMNIRVGDEVATKKGNVLIEFADSSTIRLEENSNLVFNKLSHFGKTGMVDTRLRLKRGSLSTEVTPLVKGSRYEIT
ncbi:FecR domain-containing protein, partial [Oleiphilus sp. HI0061]